LTAVTDEIRSFLNERRYAVLATLNPIGTIQQSVMWYRLDGDSIVMNTAKGRIKYRNIANNPAISICVEDELRSVTIAGNVEIDEDPERGIEEIQRLGRRYDSEAQVRADYEKSWKHQHRVTLTLPITKVVTHGFGEGH
jgi:PPOX class probable F420-dependent enzyme